MLDGCSMLSAWCPVFSVQCLVFSAQYPVLSTSPTWKSQVSLSANNPGTIHSHPHHHRHHHNHLSNPHQNPILPSHLPIFYWPHTVPRYPSTWVPRYLILSTYTCAHIPMHPVQPTLPSIPGSSIHPTVHSKPGRSRTTRTICTSTILNIIFPFPSIPPSPPNLFT